MILLYLLGLYLPFEDFILKWLPASMILYLKQIPEMLIYTILLLLLISKAKYLRVKVPSKLLVWVFALFLVYSLFIIAINDANFLYSLIQIKSIIRFMFLVFIVYLFKSIDLRTFYFFLNFLIIIGIVECIIGTIQYFYPSIKPFFVMKETPEIFGFTIEYSSLFNIRDAFGTMAHTINFATYILMSLSVLLIFDNILLAKNNLLKLPLILLHLWGLYISGSRGAFICGFLLLFWVLYQRRKKIPLLLTGVMSLIGLVYAYYSVDKGESDKNFWFFLSPEYIEVVRHQRLGIIEDIFLNYLQTPYFLIGLSPDHNKISTYLLENFNIDIPLQFTHRTIEDVYWVALIVYFGMVGFSLFSFFMFYLFLKIREIYKKSHILSIRNLALLVNSLLIMSWLLCWVMQIYDIRTFSFYLWLFAGVLLKLYRDSKLNYRLE